MKKSLLLYPLFLGGLVILIFCFCAQNTGNLKPDIKSTGAVGSKIEIDNFTGASNSVDKKNQLVYETQLNKILTSNNEVKKMTLSTSSKGNITSRTVSTACLDDVIYFITWGHHTKCNQIREQPKVSLNYGQVQINGVAEIKGNPLTEENSAYTENYKKKLSSVYNSFTDFDELVIVEVKINAFNLFKAEGNEKFMLETVDLKKKEAFDCTLYADAKKAPHNKIKDELKEEQ